MLSSVHPADPNTVTRALVSVEAAAMLKAHPHRRRIAFKRMANCPLSSGQIPIRLQCGYPLRGGTRVLSTEETTTSMKAVRLAQAALLSAARPKDKHLFGLLSLKRLRAPETNSHFEENF